MDNEKKCSGKECTDKETLLEVAGSLDGIENKGVYYEDNSDRWYNPMEDLEDTVSMDDIVICGNSDFRSIGKDDLVRIVEDSEDEYEAMERLFRETGKLYRVTDVTGYTQGDWQQIYSPVDTSREFVDYVGAMYMGKYDAYRTNNTDSEFITCVFVPHDVAWEGAEKIREFIADENGCSVDDIVVLEDGEDLDELLDESINRINIKEALNKIDVETDNEYDLYNIYESLKLDDEKKKELVEMLVAKDEPKKLYEKLINELMQQ